MYGGSGLDNLIGGAENDSLEGCSDNDILDGGLRQYTMSRGSGSDIYYVDTLGDQVQESITSGGSDYIQNTTDVSKTRDLIT